MKKMPILLCCLLVFPILLSACNAAKLQSMATPIPPETVSPVPTLIEMPTATPEPTPTVPPAYSYLPIISEANATEFVELDVFIGNVDSLAVSPDGKYLAATYSNGVGIIWDISTVKYWREWRDSPKDIFLAEGPVSFNSDSNILVTGGTLLELPSMEIIQEIPGTVTFSPVEDKFVSVDWTTMSFWELDGNQWILDYEQDSEGVVSVVFSPDGSLLGEALHLGGGEGVNIWRVSDHKLLYSFPPPEHDHPAHFNTLAYAFLSFSSDNQFVATGTKDQHVARVWNLETGELVKDLNTVVQTADGAFYVPDVACVVFSQDSKIIAIAGSNTVIFKRISDGEFIDMINIDPYKSSSPNYITACTISNDGNILFTGDSGGEVSIWGVPAPVP